LIIPIITKTGYKGDLIIDDEDWDKIKHFKLSTNKGYARGYTKQKTYFIHRIVLNAPKNMQVDHINNNRLDNKKSNLRLVNNKQNNENRKGAYSTSKTGIRGVCWYKSHKKWRAVIMSNYKQVYNKLFDSQEEAVIAVVNKRKELGFLDANS
jgi:hypothetical protein